MTSAKYASSGQMYIRRRITGLSVGIEILQLVTNRGLCEFDDVFHNVIGAVIEVGVVMIGRKLFKGEAE